ncbi:MAG: hypothetical protein IIC21_11225 [Chloroflexi bacterium]|nr:hypothetical protein [Chloroflexota bacterium]
MVDDNLEYMIGQVSGRGLGFSGRLGNTLYRIRQEQSYASKYAFDKSQYGPLAQHQTVNIEAAASPWIPGRVYRFISLISYPFILIGAGVGFSSTPTVALNGDLSVSLSVNNRAQITRIDMNGFRA